MIQLVYPFCKKCGHEGICRYQKRFGIDDQKNV